MIAASNIAQQLAERAEALAIDLTGEAPSGRTRTAVRFYPRGGLIVEIAGDRRGLWCHHGAGGVGGDCLDLIRHLRGGTLADAIAWAKHWLGTAPQPRSIHHRPARPVSTVEQAARLWREAQPAAGTIVETYLASRGLRLPDCPAIRFHPAAPRGWDRLPAMVALMTDPMSGNPVGVHRTFLRPDDGGKADGQAKMMLGHAGVVRLDDDDGCRALGIAEGIETALAVAQILEWGPCWAACSAGGIARLPVLARYEAVHIFADSDDAGAGIDAADRCALRWASAGKEARIHIPPPGRDWLDAALAVAADV